MKDRDKRAKVDKEKERKTGDRLKGNKKKLNNK